MSRSDRIIKVRLDQRFLSGIEILMSRDRESGVSSPSVGRTIKRALEHYFAAMGVEESDIREKTMNVEKEMKSMYSDVDRNSGIPMAAQLGYTIPDRCKQFWVNFDPPTVTVVHADRDNDEDKCIWVLKYAGLPKTQGEWKSYNTLKEAEDACIDKLGIEGLGRNKWKFCGRCFKKKDG